MRLKAVPHDRPLSVVLTAADWNVVMSLVVAAPAAYSMTAPVIRKMQEQLLLQTQADTNVSEQDNS